MMRLSHTALASVAALGAGAAAAAAGGSASSAREALAQDDACQAGQSGTDCAFAALQFRQGEAASAGWPRRDDAEAAERAALQAAAAEVPKVVSESTMKWMWHAEVLENSFDGLGANGSDLLHRGGAFFAPFALEFPYCQTYVTYFWPQYQFWVQEVTRRLDMVSITDKEGLRKAREFAHKAAFLANVLKFDPRKGAPWEKEVQEYMQKVASSDSMEMPKLPAFFRRTTLLDQMISPEVSMWWFTNNMCDLKWWMKEMKGSKDNSLQCWEKVQHPGYGYSPYISVMAGMPSWPADFNSTDYPEYLACQEFTLNSTMFEGVCPFSGHVERGAWEVEDWGKGVPTAEADEEVRECQAKMGELQYSQFWISGFDFSFAPGIDLGLPIFNGIPTIMNRSQYFDNGMVTPAVLQKAMKETWDISSWSTWKAANNLTNFNPFDGEPWDYTSFEDMQGAFQEVLADGEKIVAENAEHLQATDPNFQPTIVEEITEMDTAWKFPEEKKKEDEQEPQQKQD